MVIYPDIEKIIVSYLSNALTNIGETDVKVRINKSKDNDIKEVIITGSYTSEISPVHKTASIVVDIYCPTHEEANTLSLIVDSLIRGATVEGIKKVDVVLGPVRTAEASQSQKRSMSVDLVVQASNL
jgi:hypothetical protein